MTAGPPIFFWAAEDILSNFYPSPIEVDGETYATVEHYYQAQKFVTHPEIYREIVRASSPEEAKHLSRLHEKSKRRDWNEVKEGAMRSAATAKFVQHRDLQAYLLATGARELVENSPDDAYWGRLPDGRGLNRLGLILMEVRDAIKRAARV